jgi:ATP-dependent helicase/nuclease subunit B
VLEALARAEDGSVADYYDGEAGTQFAALLRESRDRLGLSFHPREWPQILAAIVAGGSVKPAPGGDGRVFIWGALEARLQSVDTLVLGGLNEGSWPRRAESDRFMSRLMKAGSSSSRRNAASARPRTISRWRWARAGRADARGTRRRRAGRRLALAAALLAAADGPEAAAMKRRGDRSPGLGARPRQPAGRRLRPAPRAHAAGRCAAEGLLRHRDRDAAARPLRRLCPRILRLQPLDPLLRDPGAAERGSLFHDIIHAFSMARHRSRRARRHGSPAGDRPPAFRRAALPPDIDAVWWPRFVDMAPRLVEWERGRPHGILSAMPSWRRARPRSA